MKNKLIIIGASGHGKVAADIAMKMKKWRDISFFDDNECIKICMGLNVIGKVDDALKYIDKSDFFVAIGDNEIRRRVQDRLINEGLSVVSLIHPNAVIGTDVAIGIGSTVMAGVVINSSSRIGKGCIINTSSSIDHDNTIDDYVHISPGVRTAGGVYIGNGSWLGIGSVVVNNINICKSCKIGAGSVVIKNILVSGTYVGVPIRRLD